MDWLLADFQIVGWHIQYWPLFIPIEIVITLLLTDLILTE